MRLSAANSGGGLPSPKNRNALEPGPAAHPEGLKATTRFRQPGNASKLLQMLTDGGPGEFAFSHA
jgi:hypothetical protein